MKLSGCAPKTTTLSSLSMLLAILPGLTVANSGFDGFYIGASFGGTEMQADVDADKSAVFAQSRPFPYHRKLLSENAPDTYNTSGIAALRLGYGKSLGTSPFYLGLELFGNIADRTASASTDSELHGTNNLYVSRSELQTDIKVKLNDAEYGFDFRPGILLSPTTLFYGRVGAAFNSLKLDVDDELTAAFHEAGTTIFATSMQQNESDSVVGLRLGLGLENAITNSLTMTADYIYTDYGSVDSSGTFGVNNLDGTTANGFSTDTSADVATHAIMLGLNYYPQGNKKHAGMEINPVIIAHFNGFYGGAKGGLLVNNTPTNVSTTSRFAWEGTPNIMVSLDESADLWENSGLGEILFGYGHLIGNSLFYAGIEAFGNLAERKLKTTDTADFSDTDDGVTFAYNNLSTTTQVSLNPLEWGADAKLGRLFSNNTLLYARVGFAVNEIKAQSTSAFTNKDVNDGSVMHVSSLYIEENKDVVGLRLGLGVEQMVWRTLAVTADYVYTDYGSIHLNGTADTEGTFDEITPNGFTNDTDIDVRTHAAMFGLAWHW